MQWGKFLQILMFGSPPYGGVSKNSNKLNFTLMLIHQEWKKTYENIAINYL